MCRLRLTRGSLSKPTSACRPKWRQTMQGCPQVYGGYKNACVYFATPCLRVPHLHGWFGVSYRGHPGPLQASCGYLGSCALDDAAYCVCPSTSRYCNPITSRCQVRRPRLHYFEKKLCCCVKLTGLMGYVVCCLSRKLGRVHWLPKKGAI